MTVRNVKKNLAGQQDLLPGLGPYKQIRRGQTVTVDGPAKSYFDLFVRSYAEAGLPVKGTFEDSCTLATVDDIAIYLADGKGYSYNGGLPHTIAATETPVGNPLWVDRSNAAISFQQSGTGAVPRTAQDKMREIVSLTDFVDLTAALSDAKLNGRIVEVFSDITVRIPTNAATMQDAVTHLSADKHRTITILIEAGHMLTAPLTLDGGDYSNFVVSSEDAIVHVVNGALVLFSDRTSWRPVFGADNGCIFPIVNVLVDLTNYKDTDGVTRNGSGVVSLRGSNIFVKPGKGCIAGYEGAIAYDAAIINCPDAIFTHAIEAGVSAWSNSSIHADRVDASFSEKYGLRSTEGASLSAKFSKVTNCGRHAARAVSAAFLDVSDSNLSYSATNAVYARHAGVVNANNSNLSNSGTLPPPGGEINAAVYALRGSAVSAIESNADNSVTGFIADSGSTIACAVSSVRSCTNGFIALRGSTIDGDSCDATGTVNAALINEASKAVLKGLICPSPTLGIRVLNNSSVDCRNATVTGSGGTALSVFGGSSACADNSTFTGATSNAVYALGSVVSAKGANCNNSNRGFVSEDGSSIDAESASANNCVDGVYALSGGRIAFNLGFATTCTRGVRADGGVVVATGSTLTGATSSGVFAEKGSDVNLADANCRKGASDSASDIQCVSGSIIRTYKTIGGTNIAKNTPSASGLILG